MLENVKIRPFGQRKGTKMSDEYAHEVKKHVIWIIRSFFMLAFVSIRLVVEKLGKVGKISIAYSVRETSAKVPALTII